MKEIMFSIIVPVYNVEKYIKQCVESVLQQTYADYELILVDDGSTDDSGKICEEYSKREGRVKVIHKENEGAACARNVGIECALGDYIMFLDADDYWNDRDVLIRLRNRLKKRAVDILNFGYIKYYEDTNINIKSLEYKDMPLNMTQLNEQLEYLLDNFLFVASAWNKCISKELLKTGILFEGGKTSEDIQWSLKLLLVAKSVDYICEHFYVYRQRNGSVTHTLSSKLCDDLADNIIQTICIIESEKGNNKILFYQYAAYQFATFVALQGLCRSEPRDSIRKLKAYCWVLQYFGKSKKVRVIYILVKLFDFNVTCKIIRCTRGIWDRLRKAK